MPMLRLEDMLREDPNRTFTHKPLRDTLDEYVNSCIGSGVIYVDRHEDWGLIAMWKDYGASQGDWCYLGQLDVVGPRGRMRMADWRAAVGLYRKYSSVPDEPPVEYTEVTATITPSVDYKAMYESEKAHADSWKTRYEVLKGKAGAITIYSPQVLVERMHEDVLVAETICGAAKVYELERQKAETEKLCLKGAYHWDRTGEDVCADA